MATYYGGACVRYQYRWCQLLLPVRRRFLDVLSLFCSRSSSTRSLNSSALKDVAIFGAALTLLDDVATSVVSAGTAAAYIATEAGLRIDVALTVVLIVGIALFGLLGIKGNAEVMTTVLVFVSLLLGACAKARRADLFSISAPHYLRYDLCRWRCSLGPSRKRCLARELGDISAGQCWRHHQADLPRRLRRLPRRDWVSRDLLERRELIADLPIHLQIRDGPRLHLLRAHWRLSLGPPFAPSVRHHLQRPSHARHLRRPTHERRAGEPERAEQRRAASSGRVAKDLGHRRRRPHPLRHNSHW